MSLDAQIEAILFFHAEPIEISELARLLGISETELTVAFETLETRLKNGGTRVVRDEKNISLATASEAAPLIKKFRTEELSRDLSKAALETLSIVLYRAPVSRMEIDHIRGVNSQTILRTLAIRGLIERVEDASGRSTQYRPTLDLLAHLGVARIEELPEYAAFREEIQKFETIT